MRTDQLYHFVDNISHSLLEQTGAITLALAEEVRPIDATLSRAMIEWIRAREAVSRYLALRGEGSLKLIGPVPEREPVTKDNFPGAAAEILAATKVQIRSFIYAAGLQGSTVQTVLRNMADTLDTQLSAKLLDWDNAAFPVRLHILSQRRPV